MTGVGAKAAFGLLGGIALAAAQPAAAVPHDFTDRADALIESAYPADGPGAAVIVTENGRTVYSRGRGLADVEARRPIEPDTVFRLGSITKQFTAAVVLQLAQEGRLSLDDPLSRFFPDYPEPGARATVRQLLNHTVGIQSYTGIPGWMVEENTARPHSTAEMVAIFRDLPSPSEPGQAWSYNNSGYVMLGAIVEQVTGRPWHEAVEGRIARPLGLGTIRYGVAEAEIPAMARGYTERDGVSAPANRIHMSVPHAAGALVGTVGDLAAWNAALHGGRVVEADSLAAMVAPTVLPSGDSVPYGFGLGLAEVRGRPGIGHGGGIFGFSTDSLYLPEQEIFIAVFANSDDPATPPGVLLQRLAALAVDDPHPEFRRAAVDPASLEPLFGLYRIDGGDAERSFFARDGRLYTRRGGGAELEVFPAGQDLFFYGPNSLTWFRVRRDAGGAHAMEMHQNGAVAAERAVRTGPVPPEPAAADVPRATLERYVGAYALGQARLTIAMGEDGRLTAQLTGQSALPLQPTSATEFMVQGVDARLVFSTEGEAVTALTLHQSGRQISAPRLPAGS